MPLHKISNSRAIVSFQHHVIQFTIEVDLTQSFEAKIATSSIAVILTAFHISLGVPERLNFVGFALGIYQIRLQPTDEDVCSQPKCWHMVR